MREKRYEMQETENEILARLPSLLGDAPCASFDRPNCNKSEHLCMQAITVEKVCGAVKKLLEGSYPKQQKICANKNS